GQPDLGHPGVALHGGGPPPGPFTLDHAQRVPRGCDNKAGGKRKTPGSPSEAGDSASSTRGLGLSIKLNPPNIEHKPPGGCGSAPRSELGADCQGAARRGLGPHGTAAGCPEGRGPPPE